VSSFFPISSDATFSTDYPLSDGNLSNIVIYSGDTLREMLGDRSLASTDDKFNELASEFTRVLDKGPGVLVIKDCFNDHTLLDGVTAAFDDIIKTESEGKVAGDHFSGAGNNSRIWNAQEKLAVAAPDLYVPYYNNKLLAAVSLAWLGPHYQMTSQVNSSHPGSAAQDPHCDYHLGFRSDEQVVEVSVGGIQKL
jgi:ectoine hydroxylase-related dioxygenase (phytanoyl-CoA dioxygenase family)